MKTVFGVGIEKISISFCPKASLESAKTEYVLDIQGSSS